MIVLATGLGPLELLLADPSVDEVMVNGPDSVYVERRGRLERVGVRFTGEGELMHAIERCWRRSGGGWTRRRRCATRAWGRVAGERGDPAAVAAGAVPDGAALPARGLLLRELVANGTMPAALAELLAVSVAARASILVSGGIGRARRRR